MEDEKRDQRGFTVTDRRRFTESGDQRDTAAGDAPTSPPADAAEASHPAAAGPRAAAEPPVSFASFVLGLSTQALMSLGEVEDPGTHRRSADLPAARHLIDLLAILQEKTRNNLDPDEHALLESALYDLRVRFVALVRQGAKEER